MAGSYVVGVVVLMGMLAVLGIAAIAVALYSDRISDDVTILVICGALMKIALGALICMDIT